jgi:hypothetical protein
MRFQIGADPAKSLVRLNLLITSYLDALSDWKACFMFENPNKASIRVRDSEHRGSNIICKMIASMRAGVLARKTPADQPHHQARLESDLCQAVAHDDCDPSDP